MPQSPHRHEGTGGAPANNLATRLSPFWSTEKVCAELGLARAELEEAVERYAVLGLVTSDDVLLFPVAQFEHADDRVRVRPGIAAMLPELRHGDPWSVAQLMTAPADELGSRSPYEAERDGAATGELVEYARLVSHEWRN